MIIVIPELYTSVFLCLRGNVQGYQLSARSAVFAAFVESSEVEVCREGSDGLGLVFFSLEMCPFSLSS